MATERQCRDFIGRIGPLAQAEARMRGYKVCSAAIAQACVESGWGLSGLARFHNYFGMKCGSKWKGASVDMKTMEEYSPGALTEIRDNFRAYPSMEEGVKGYYDFISAPRYAKLKDAATPLEYARALKAAGYATSSKYVQTLANCVSQWGLGAYDAAPQYKIGRAYVTQVDLNVREAADVKSRSLRVLPKGSRVECQGGGVIDGDTWFRLEDGWIAAHYKDKAYVK